MKHVSTQCYESKFQILKGLNRLDIGDRYFMRKFSPFEILVTLFVLINLVELSHVLHRCRQCSKIAYISMTKVNIL